MRSALFTQVGGVLGAVGYKNVRILLRLRLQHFDRKMVSSKPRDITGVQGEVLTSHVTFNPLQGRETFCVWPPNCKLGQLCTLSSSPMPERHPFRGVFTL